MASPMAVHALQNRIDQAQTASGVPSSNVDTNSSPQVQSSSLPSSKPPTRPPSRTDQLPTPPETLEVSTFQTPTVRYLRMGDPKDAVGKGVFGIVFAYRLDESSCPKNPSPASSSSSEEKLSPQNLVAEEPSTLRLIRLSSYHSPPSVVAVKICRTPQNGVFDELPKTGLCRSLAKQAQKSPETVGFHTRVVRGESRIVKYLQLAQQVLERKGEGLNSGSEYIVKMFDDVDISGKNERKTRKVQLEDGNVVEEDVSSIESDDSVPTVPNRLLVFESLVELDAPVMRSGSRVKTSSWSMEEVFMTSLEVIQGLKFCHQNNVAHGDLKPSNLMRDPVTGVVKLIDFGASRRFVRIQNIDVYNIDAVDEIDAAFERGEPYEADQTWCGGLNSLTGSPHFMAPEILMQASKYTDDRGHARSVLHDYSARDAQKALPPGSEALFDQCCADFEAGWNQLSDVWSWGCTVLSLWLRSRPSFRATSKNSSEATLCPFDFRFSTPTDDALVPLHTPSFQDSNLPRFHMWARVFPLRIASITQNMRLPPEALDEIPASLVEMIMGALQHASTRLTAQKIASYLEKLDPREAASQTRALQKKIDRATSAPNLREKMKTQRARPSPSPLASERVKPPPPQSHLAFPKSTPVPESPKSRGDASLLSDSIANNRSNAGSEQGHGHNSAVPQPSYIATQLLTFPPADRSRHGSSTSISQDESGRSGEETEATSRSGNTQKETEELEELKSVSHEDRVLEGSTTQTSPLSHLEGLGQAIFTSPPVSPVATVENEESSRPKALAPQSIILPKEAGPQKKVVNRPRSESATLMLTSAGKREPVQLQMHQISLGPASNVPVASEHLSPTPHRLPTSWKDAHKRKSSKMDQIEEAPGFSNLSRTDSKSSNLRRKLLSSPSLKAALKLRRSSQQFETEPVPQDHSLLVQSSLRSETGEPSHPGLSSPSAFLVPQATSNLEKVSEDGEGEKSEKRSRPKLSKSRSSRLMKRMLSWSGIKEEGVPPVPSPPSRALSMASPISHSGESQSALGLNLGGVDLRPAENQAGIHRSHSITSKVTSDQATVRRRRDRRSSLSQSLSSVKSFDALRKMSLRSSKRPCMEDHASQSMSRIELTTPSPAKLK